MKPHTARPANATPNHTNEFFQRAGAFATALLTSLEDTFGSHGYVEGRGFGLVAFLDRHDLWLGFLVGLPGKLPGVAVLVTRRVDQVHS